MSIFTKNRTALPGFGLSLGFTIFYLSLIVLIPLSALFLKAASIGSSEFWAAATGDRAIASYKLTFGASAVAALINAVFGLLTAWTLTRYKFPGRRFFDAIVDLPFAIPTAVSGIALTAVYSHNGIIGAYLEKFGIKAAFTPLGVTIALTFIGLPFVVRTVQPALQELDKDLEEAAASLGANRFQIFFRVITLSIMPSLLTGFALAFARAVGEYGSVVFISGNMPMKTEISSLLIIVKLEQYDYAGASVIATVMLIFSFLILLLINIIQALTQRNTGKG